MVTLMRLSKRGQQAEPAEQAEQAEESQPVDPNGTPTGKAGASINGAGGPGSGPLGGRLPLVLALSVVLVLAVAGIGYLQLSGQSSDLGQTQLTTTRASARHSASPSGSPSASGSASSTAIPAAKDPFATGPVSPSATGSPITGTTGSPTAGTSGSSTPSVSTSIAITATVTRYSTVTAPAALYLGLSGWTSADLPMFWVNHTFATPAVGATFATSFTYVGQVVVNGVTCADVTYAGVDTRVCEGQAVKVG